MSKVIDITGNKYGNLTVLCSAGSNKYGEKMWLCECSCGKFLSIRGSALRSGHTQSCGCLAREKAATTQTKHGHCKRNEERTPLYGVWASMKDRCVNANNKSYHRYGYRAIKVCQEWRSFDDFYKWAVTNGYRHGLTIERVDNDGDYCPKNCRWATRKEQANNTSRNRIVEYMGKKMTLQELSDFTGVCRDTISKRLKNGMSVKEAVTTPVRRHDGTEPRNKTSKPDNRRP